MKEIAVVGATTNIDLEGERLSKADLEQLASARKSTLMPIFNQHDHALPPVGRSKSHEVREIGNGHWGLYGIWEVWEPGDEHPGCRYLADQESLPTNGGGFPSLGDADRESDRDFDILRLEEEILTLLNHARQTRGVDPVALHSDLLYQARRHSLRMIKLPFFGTKDPERGDVCDSLIRERGADVAGAKVLRIRDDTPNPAAYCLDRWTRWSRTRRILLHPGFSLCAIGIIRSARGRAFYITCLLEANREPPGHKEPTVCRNAITLSL